MQRELKKLSGQDIERIVRRLEHLTSNPRPPGCKKLAGGDAEWRIRIGDYRAVYLIDDANKRVEVTRIAHRGTVYKS